MQRRSKVLESKKSNRNQISVRIYFYDFCCAPSCVKGALLLINGAVERTKNKAPLLANFSATVMTERKHLMPTCCYCCCCRGKAITASCFLSEVLKVKYITKDDILEVRLVDQVYSAKDKEDK